MSASTPCASCVTATAGLCGAARADCAATAATSAGATNQKTPRRPMCGRVAARSDGVHGPSGRSAGTEGPTVRQNGGMSLHAGPLEQDATLPDGRVVRVRIGVPEDGYVAERKIDTVTAEIYGDGKHLAVVSTILEPEQLDEARAMLR